MVLCFLYRCNHNSLWKSCKFYALCTTVPCTNRVHCSRCVRAVYIHSRVQVVYMARVHSPYTAVQRAVSITVYVPCTRPCTDRAVYNCTRPCIHGRVHGRVCIRSVYTAVFMARTRLRPWCKNVSDIKPMYINILMNPLLNITEWHPVTNYFLGGYNCSFWYPPVIISRQSSTCPALTSFCSKINWIWPSFT